MAESVHYVYDAHNVKSNRGGITGYILLSHFLACKLLYTHIIVYFYAIFIILYVYFIVHIVAVLFCMQINK